MSSYFSLLIVLCGVVSSMGEAFEEADEQTTPSALFNEVDPSIQSNLSSDSQLSLANFPSRLEKYINCLIANYRTDLKSRDVEIDPFTVAMKPTNVDLGIFKGLIQIHELKLEGMTNIKVRDAKFIPHAAPFGGLVKANLEWPEIKMAADYSSNITFMGKTANATENGSASVNGFSVAINSNLTGNGKTMKVLTLNVKPSLEKSTFKFNELGFDLYKLWFAVFYGAVEVINRFPNLLTSVLGFSLLGSSLLDNLNDRLLMRANYDGHEENTLSSFGCQLRLF